MKCKLSYLFFRFQSLLYFGLVLLHLFEVFGVGSDNSLTFIATIGVDVTPAMEDFWYIGRVKII